MDHHRVHRGPGRGEVAVHPEEVEPLEGRRGDDRGHLGVVEHVADLVAPVDRHDRHHDRAEAGQCDGDDREL
jgi:hypothetical protein